jgi:hypothetical protein
VSGSGFTRFKHQLSSGCVDRVFRALAIINRFELHEFEVPLRADRYVSKTTFRETDE